MSSTNKYKQGEVSPIAMNRLALKWRPTTLDISSFSVSRKTRKLVNNPALFIDDFLKKKGGGLKQKIDDYSGSVPSSRYHYRLYHEQKKLNYRVRSEKSLRQAIKFKKNPMYYHELGLRLNQKAQWWQAVDAFKNAISLDMGNNKNWYKDLAIALMKMLRNQEASTAWNTFLSSNDGSSNDWYLYGHSLEISGNKGSSHSAYQKAIQRDSVNNSQEFGIGIFHEKRGDWLPASQAYHLQLRIDPLNADLRYKYALSLDRCYLWEEAKEAYIDALSLQPKNSYWHYRLGFVLERLKSYEDASQYYAYAATNATSHKPDWFYRLGFVLQKTGRYRDASAAFLMMKKIERKQFKNTTPYPY